MKDLPSVFLCAHPHLAVLVDRFTASTAVCLLEGRDEFLSHLHMLEAQWLDLQDYISIETSMGSSMPSLLSWSTLRQPLARFSVWRVCGEEYSCPHADSQFESHFLSPGPTPVRITLPDANPSLAPLAGETASAPSISSPFLVALAASNTPVHTVPELIHQISTMEDVLVATFNGFAVEEEAIDLKAELRSSIHHDRVTLLTLIHDLQMVSLPNTKFGFALARLSRAFTESLEQHENLQDELSILMSSPQFLLLIASALDMAQNFDYSSLAQTLQEAT
ncbi:uncharacterized protein LAESUDRAFT_761410 [Laetiporus sulphureus 93-53]|uniref:Uncharacterized protein n=1 Tax=Laetiporus sulphureus 93-53 TaxID=1314785 RepID=A0A165D331_9APHY|nr:uncharacterized protein LAESUDRAFT_761410 [Laetiporus sulphureus 93-53]KZT04060.1 hypothetical protein LAESUDRAFT_761410 [Laetiporus sulphureus 93-53]